MLESETIQLLTFDMQNFPHAGCKPSHVRVNIDGFEEKELLTASDLINKEMNSIKKELKLEDVDEKFIISKQEDS